MKTDKQNKAFFWATTFLRELHAHGISQLVISPGSRSTPLTVAAAVHPGFTTHTVLDERSAGFIALGIAKASGIPAGLICTSGTAAANYFPAIIEARHSGVPMLLLTADRPPNLRNIGASQAIDQVKMFGDYPVFFHEAGEPVLEPEDLQRLRTAASQSVCSSIKRKGPAHINFPFRKPLEPDPEYVQQVERENRNSSIENAIPQTKVFQSSSGTSIPAELQKLLSECKRPLVIEGPTGSTSSTKPAASLAKVLNAPLLSEFPGTAHPNRITGFDGFLKNRSMRTELRPDLILRFGMQPVSKAMDIYLKELTDIPHIHFAELDEWQDATHTVSHRIEWSGDELNWEISSAQRESNWLDGWKKIDNKFKTNKARQLNSEDKLTDGHIFHHLGEQIPDQWNVFLSNSFPVRDWMLFAGSPPHPTFVNRGASGIDGIISTAIGGTIASQQPGILFIGDLATLHDSNALLSAPLLKHPLVIIILNNGGGNIFRMLPIYQHQTLYKEYFETPQKINFNALADSHGLPYVLVDTIDQLNKINIKKYTAPGLHLVECKTNSDASMQIRHNLWNFSIT